MGLTQLQYTLFSLNHSMASSEILFLHNRAFLVVDYLVHNHIHHKDCLARNHSKRIHRDYSVLTRIPIYHSSINRSPSQHLHLAH